MVTIFEPCKDSGGFFEKSFAGAASGGKGKNKARQRFERLYSVSFILMTASLNMWTYFC